MNAFICPVHKKQLFIQEDSLKCLEGCAYPMRNFDKQQIVDFSGRVSEENKNLNEVFYHGADQNNIYKNYLEWLFATFKTQEESFRKRLLEKLKLHSSSKILVTGCGNGDDVLAVTKNLGNLHL